jgi:DNA-binding transcriptional LysR family regulator
MAVFVRVVQAGSFSNASRTLDMTASAVSKLVTRLEQRLGTVLMHRSTRELVLTPAGTEFYDSAVRILEDIDEAEQAVGEGVSDPKGVLRVNTSTPFGTHQLLPLLPAFRARFPSIVLDVSLTDNVVDLTRERVDVAIRVGRLRDAAFKARLLGESFYVVVASPDYLARHGVPGAPEDLRLHTCLDFNFRRSVAHWPFQVDGKTTSYPVRGAVLTNNGETMLGLTLLGLGISRLGRFHVQHEIEAGRLVPLLDAFNPGDVEPVHAVFPAQRHMPQRVRVFIDFLVERIGPALAGLPGRSGKPRA